MNVGENSEIELEFILFPEIFIEFIRYQLCLRCWDNMVNRRNDFLAPCRHCLNG